MAKTKSKGKAKNSRHDHRKERDILRTANAPLVKPSTKTKSKPQKSILDLLTESARLLEQSQPELALPLAEEALRRLEQEKDEVVLRDEEDEEVTLPAVTVLVAEIQISIGDVDAARKNFLIATHLDADGLIVSAEPWLWLAQLSESGGQESISYFTKAAEILRREIGVLLDLGNLDEEGQMVLEEKQGKLADALCAMAEVYMTDLSWEEDAEEKCEKLVTEAMVVVPETRSAGTLQCLASVRISQEKAGEAREALGRSLAVWKDDLEQIPEFATRVSLARLLMEVEMLEEGMGVLEGLVKEDDQSVEVWYLGGWCQMLMAAKIAGNEEESGGAKDGARQWLGNCLRLSQLVQYEDERLKQHAEELVAELNRELGNESVNDEDWEDEDDEEEDRDGEEGNVEVDGEDQDVDMT